MSRPAERAPGAPIAVTRHRRRQPARQRPRRLRRGAVRRAARRCVHARSTCRASSCRRSPVAPAAFDAAPQVAPSRVPLDRGHRDGAPRRAQAAARWPGSTPAAIDPRAPRRLLGQRHGAAPRPSRRPVAPSTPTGAACGRPASSRRCRTRPSPSSRSCFGARGAALAYACACASSAVAIGEAMRAIRAGWIDVAIAGGSESMLTPGVLASWQAMRVLAPLARMPAPDADAVARVVPAVLRRPCRLRARRGRGRVRARVGRACAQARGVAVEATLAGYATNCDGMHITNPDPAGQARAMRAALADAGLASRPTSATSTRMAPRRSTATPPRRARSPRSSARAACRSARPRRSTATCSAPAARSSCSRRCARWRASACRRPRTRAALDPGVRDRPGHRRRRAPRPACATRCRTRSRSAARTRC